jgi:transposase
VFEGKVRSNPGALADVIRKHAPHADQIASKTSAVASWLWHELKRIDLRVVRADARHAHAALSVGINKSDPNDGRRLADLIRVGWYREVRAKSDESQAARHLLVARARPVSIVVTSGTRFVASSKGLGFLSPRAIRRQFRFPICRLLDERHLLRPIIEGLLAVDERVKKLQAVLDARVLKETRE